LAGSIYEELERMITKYDQVSIKWKLFWNSKRSYSGSCLMLYAVSMISLHKYHFLNKTGITFKSNQLF
jgi:hypothetical protein